MILLALRFMLSILFAMPGTPLEVSSVVVEKNDNHPSCLLLKHRALQRARVLAELKELMAKGGEDIVASVLEQNSLITNKLFLDESVWQDEAGWVHLEVQVSEALAQELSSERAVQTFLHIQGPGLSWSSTLEQLPTDLAFAYEPELKRLRLSYPVYIYDLCENPDQNWQVGWAQSQETL